MAALCPETAGLAQPGQALLRVQLLKKGVDRFADQGALAAAATAQRPVTRFTPPSASRRRSPTGCDRR